MSLVAALRPSGSIALYRPLSRRHPRLFCSDGVSRVEYRRPASAKAQACAVRVRGNAQITAHGRARNPLAAQAVFDGMLYKDVISWTALLTAYAENGELRQARKVFDGMPKRNVASWNAMISAYAREKRVREAFELFEGTPERNAVTYAAMISGFARAGMMREAEELYARTPRPWKDPVASNSLLSGYLQRGDLAGAAQVFQGMATRDVVSWSSMVDGYCKEGMLEEARRTFGMMPERNVVSWTAMIRGYMKAGLWEDGLRTFAAMRREEIAINAVTLSVILGACAEPGRIREGAQTHGLIQRQGFSRDSFLCNSLIAMYSSSAKHVDDARRVFEEMEEKDVVSWNSIIGGYVRGNRVQPAHELFLQMPTKDVISWTSMLLGFSNSGRLAEAVRLFEEMPKKDDVAWTAMVSGFVANEEHELAFRWFNHMLRERISPNHLSLSSILSASSGLSILSQGAQVHALAVKTAMESELSVRNALVSMYSKCGSLPDARRTFSSIKLPNVVSMNAMITALAQHGLAQEALELYSKMAKKGCEPNDVTFLALLSACSHAGLVEEGLALFRCMHSLYGIEPGPDHHTSMVDLLGRAGMLEEAAELIGSMRAEPHSAIWGALLGASRAHRHLPLAEHAAGRIFELEPDNAAAYAVLSGMYAVAGLKKDEEEVRTAKRSSGVRKNPGCSWITLENRVAVFLAGRNAHSECEIILASLAALSKDIEAIGCG